MVTCLVLVCFRWDVNQRQLSRSSSIDSIVEAASAGFSYQESSTNTLLQPRRVPSPLLPRPERPVPLVSPSVGRRMKGQRAVSGRRRLSYLNLETQLSGDVSGVLTSGGRFNRTTEEIG